MQKKILGSAQAVDMILAWWGRQLQGSFLVMETIPSVI